MQLLTSWHFALSSLFVRRDNEPWSIVDSQVDGWEEFKQRMQKVW